MYVVICPENNLLNLESTNEVQWKNAYCAVQRSTVARIFVSVVPPMLVFNLTAVATTELKERVLETLRILGYTMSL